MTVRPAKTAEPIVMPLRVLTVVSPRNRVGWGFQIPQLGKDIGISLHRVKQCSDLLDA